MAADTGDDIHRRGPLHPSRNPASDQAPKPQPEPEVRSPGKQGWPGAVTVGCGRGGGCAFLLDSGHTFGGIMAALGFFFIILPCLAIASFTCFAACRAQQRRVFKGLAYVCLTVGLVGGLTPVGVLIWLSAL
ncbi:hypothetical protein ACFVWY_20770 [Streptomyces sp. NPDC058195]|uniref:hypothetical protein n=1 Tax=Streptomyces sp. NPDC058195 TaxID=3346375 RepID=UPI0036EB51BF